MSRTVQDGLAQVLAETREQVAALRAALKRHIETLFGAKSAVALDFARGTPRDYFALAREEEARARRAAAAVRATWPRLLTRLQVHTGSPATLEQLVLAYAGDTDAGAALRAGAAELDALIARIEAVLDRSFGPGDRAPTARAADAFIDDVRARRVALRLPAPAPAGALRTNPR